MTEEEYNIKYGVFRHEVYRTGKLGRRSCDIVQSILYWMELNLVHFGEKNLTKKIDIDRPIFIIGDFRSGTSILERLIEHHPDVGSFNLTDNVIWQAPRLWNLLVELIYHIRLRNGHDTWLSPYHDGAYFPHSSNNRLTRLSSFELEMIWRSCQQNMTQHRNYNWETLNDEILNEDNQSNEDLLTSDYNDPPFEHKLKNVIRMLLLERKCKRFINKNPLNGFRLGYLKKIFPNGKFIFISRDPIRTLESQILMHDNTLRCMYVNEKEFRVNNMEPYIPNTKELKEKYDNKHWAYLTHSVYPNDHGGELMIPRIFPRTYPEHLQICKYLKQEKRYCAFAMAIRQHERVVMEEIQEKKKNEFVEGENLMILYHEDILDNPFDAFEKILQFCELDSTKEHREQWLKLENFRHKDSRNNLEKTTSTKGLNDIIQQDTKQVHNHSMFKDETLEIMDILQPCLNRFNNRTSLQNRIKNKGIWKK